MAALAIRIRLSSSLTLFFGIRARRPFHTSSGFSFCRKGGRHRLGVAGVDQHAGRAGRAESDAGELQPGRGVARAGADQVHGVLVGAALVEQLEAVVDRADRRNDVVAHAAAEQRGEIYRGKREQVGHDRLSPDRSFRRLKRSGRHANHFCTNQTLRYTARPCAARKRSATASEK